MRQTQQSVEIIAAEAHRERVAAVTRAACKFWDGTGHLRGKEWDGLFDLIAIYEPGLHPLYVMFQAVVTEFDYRTRRGLDTPMEDFVIQAVMAYARGELDPQEAIELAGELEEDVLESKRLRLVPPKPGHQKISKSGSPRRSSGHSGISIVARSSSPLNANRAARVKQ